MIALSMINTNREVKYHEKNLKIHNFFSLFFISQRRNKKLFDFSICINATKGKHTGNKDDIRSQ